MKKIIIVTFSVLVFLLALSVVPALAVGTNGSFEIGTDPGVFATLSAGNTNITDWTINSGSVDYIGTYWLASNGLRSIDLNGLASGSISQVLATVVGATYNVTFDLSGNPDSLPASDPLYSPSLKDVQVSATGATPQDFTYDTSVKGNSLSNMKWEKESYSFVATGTSTTLTFASQIAGAFGPALDNVVIAQMPTVPMITSPSSNICVTSANQQLIDWTDSTGTYTPIIYQYQAFSDSAYTALIYDSGMALTASQIPTPGTPDGIYYIRVRAQDSVGNLSAWSNGSSNPYKITVSDTFVWSQLLPPLNISGKTYKAGSTIPVKVQILDACGNGVNMGLPSLVITGPSTVVVNPFRYDASAGQYISNWSTKVPTALPTGIYTITVGPGTVSGATGVPPTATAQLVR